MGQVTVFVPEDERLYPDRWYGNAAEIVSRRVLDKGIDINNPEHIRQYYTELFADARDQETLTKGIRERDYEQVDKQYRLITSTGEKLIVPYSGMMEKYHTICEELKKQGITPGLMRETAPITITVFDRGNLEQFAEPIFLRKRTEGKLIPSGYWILRKQYEHCYTADGGLKLPDSNQANLFVGYLY